MTNAFLALGLLLMEAAEIKPPIQSITSFTFLSRLLPIVLQSRVAMAATTFNEFSRLANGTTSMEVTGADQDRDEIVNSGSGNNITWSNRIGENPFDQDLQNSEVVLATPVTFSSLIMLNAVILDSNSDVTLGQDYPTLKLSGIFPLDDPCVISGSSNFSG